MESTSAILRKAIIKAMKDGKEREVLEIKEAVQEKSGLVYGVDYQEGHLAGCLRVLKNSGKLQLQGRGRYLISSAEREILPATIPYHQEAVQEEHMQTAVPHAGDVSGKDEQWKPGRLLAETYAALELQYQYLLEQIHLIGEINLLKISDAQMQDIIDLRKLKENLEVILKNRESSGRE